MENNFDELVNASATDTPASKSGRGRKEGSKLAPVLCRATDEILTRSDIADELKTSLTNITRAIYPQYQTPAERSAIKQENHKAERIRKLREELAKLEG